METMKYVPCPLISFVGQLLGVSGDAEKRVNVAEERASDMF
jgi:hypothetical protein